MATLTGSTIASTYKQLLKVTSEGIGDDASAKYIEDGLGTDSALSISTTRVGIGNSAPSYLLHVATASGATDGKGIALTDSAGQLISHLAFQGTTDGSEYGVLNMYNNGTQTVKINSNGDNTYFNGGSVGIGTDAPSDYDAGADNLVVYDSVNAGISIIAGTSGTSAIHFGDGTSAASYRGYINYSHGSSDAFTFATGATARMTIDSSGNVGIGATAKLFLDGSAATGNTYITETSADILKVYAGGNICGTYRDSGFAIEATSKLWLDGAGNTYLHEVSADAVQIVAGGTSVFEVDANSRISLSNNDSSGAVGTTLFGYNAGLNIVSGCVDNTFIGHAVADATLTNAADYNTGVGGSSLSSLTSGYSNAAFGFQSLFSNTDGFQNTAIGTTSLYHNAGTDNNTAVGDQAGFYTQGASNTYIGQAAGKGAAGADANNVGVGASALLAITTGADNTVIGTGAADAITDGHDNVILGSGAGTATTSVGYSVVIGRAAGQANMTAVADGSIAIGYQSLQDLIGGAGNTAVGYRTLETITTATNNVALGYQAMQDTKAGTVIDGCIGIGYQALLGNASQTTGINGTVAIGKSALTALTTGAGNTAVGYQALNDEDAGSYSTAVGYQSLSAQDVDAGGNTAVGYQSGMDVTTGTYNTLYGRRSGYELIGGANNTFLGNYAGGNTTAAGNCVVIGAIAANSNMDANANGTVAVGYSALNALTSGAGNVAVGYQALDGITTSTNNTALGYNALGACGDSYSNVAIGKDAGDTIANSGGLNTVIGTSADVSTGAAENQIVIGNGTTGVGNNSVTLGNDAVTAVYMASDKGAKVYCAEIEMGTVSTGSEGWSIPADMISRSYHAGTGSQAHMIFHNGNGDVGSIDSSGTATAYNTSSDYRLKENEVTLLDGITRLKNLKPYRFNFKSDKDKTLDGFFAHEVAEVVPEAITGEKDAVDDDGNMIRQGIDHSKLVPLLVKAVQELTAKVEALENK